jgi:hypothetical protein
METLMSKGPGRIERAILAAVEADPDNAFTTAELVEKAFPRIKVNYKIRKKHRVSVLRAAKKLTTQGKGLNNFLTGEGLGGQLVFFNRYNVKSYAMARLKADRCNLYRTADPRLYYSRPFKTSREQENNLREMLIPGGSDHKHIVEGGAWWHHVREWCAEQYLRGPSGTHDERCVRHLP